MDVLGFFFLRESFEKREQTGNIAQRKATLHDHENKREESHHPPFTCFPTHSSKPTQKAVTMLRDAYQRFFFFFFFIRSHSRG